MTVKQPSQYRNVYGLGRASNEVPNGFTRLGTNVRGTARGGSLTNQEKRSSLPSYDIILALMNHGALLPQSVDERKILAPNRSDGAHSSRDSASDGILRSFAQNTQNTHNNHPNSGMIAKNYYYKK